MSTLEFHMPIRTRTKSRTTRKNTTRKATKKPAQRRTATTGPVLNLVDMPGGPALGVKVRIFSSAAIPVQGRH